MISDGSENLHKHIELIQEIKMLIKDSKHKLILLSTSNISN